jgi:hypothetical protein
MGIDGGQDIIKKDSAGRVSSISLTNRQDLQIRACIDRTSKCDTSALATAELIDHPSMIDATLYRGTHSNACGINTMNTIKYGIQNGQTNPFRRLPSDHLVGEAPSRASMHRLCTERSAKSHATRYARTFNNKIIKHLIILMREKDVFPNRRRQNPVR